MTTPTLRNISEIRSFYRTNEEPIYFVGPTPFNLLGLDRWVRNFNYLTYYDPWDGEHPRLLTPSRRSEETFTSSEQITNFLLTDDEMRMRLAARGGTPRVMAVFIDEETEAICRDLGYRLTLPPVALRKRLDSKLETTRLGNEAGAPSVPNTLAAAAPMTTCCGSPARPGSAVTWSSSCPMATPARRRSSLRARRIGTSMPTTSPARTPRS
jgi:hypothetical protein